jgi:drug/metabolite transporter (DMT)-like permease
MAQTKRKRRSKHRGNAAGQIESRGRTGRRPTAEELRKTGGESARERRMNRPPSWNSAFLKAALMAALLFLLTQIGVFGSEASLSQSIVLCAFAVVLYTPLAYVTDRWVYQRAQRRKQQQK